MNGCCIKINSHICHSNIWQLYICTIHLCHIENRSIFLGKWIELGLWLLNLFLLVVLEEEQCTSFALLPEMNSEEDKEIAMTFPLLSFIFRTRRFIMQRIHTIFIGFIFLSTSSLSVFRCICKFTVLLTFIRNELKEFFSKHSSLLMKISDKHKHEWKTCRTEIQGKTQKSTD